MQKSPEQQRSPIESEGIQSKKCFICSKGFSLRKKHSCKFCWNAVCAEHCKRTRNKEGFDEAQPICDLCNQEQVKKDLENEMLLEIESLEEELKQARMINDRLERENFEKTANVNKIEIEIEELCEKQGKILKSLENELAGELIQSQGISDLFEKTQNSIEESKAEEETALAKLENSKADLENYAKQCNILVETKDGQRQQLERINNKLKGSLSMEQVSKLLCPACTEKLNQAAIKKNTSPSILEDATISISLVDERQSILESVREYKEILSQQAENPNEESKCLIM